MQIKRIGNKMKAQNKITPALFINLTKNKNYQVVIDLGNNRWAELNFSERDWAVGEYNRIKGLGIYCGSWIKEITLKETKDETMA
jgi:hypothetical protein